MKQEEFLNIQNLFVENGYEKLNDYCYKKIYSCGVCSYYQINKFYDCYKLTHLIDDELIFSDDFESLLSMYKSLVKIFGNKQKGRL